MSLTRLIETLLPQAARDVVAVFTQDFTQVFPRARAIKAVVKEEAKVMEHPVETGAIITDHRIILPVEIELSLILLAGDYADTYRQIRSYYLNSTLLVVQTRSGVYQNQMIQGMPHEEDPEQQNVLALALKMKQVQFATAVYGVVPRHPKNSKTVQRGVQQTKPATTVGADLADKASAGFRGLFH